VIYGKWSVQASKEASKQANVHTHGCNEVTPGSASPQLYHST